MRIERIILRNFRQFRETMIKFQKRPDIHTGPRKHQRDVPERHAGQVDQNEGRRRDKIRRNGDEIHL